MQKQLSCLMPDGSFSEGLISACHTLVLGLESRQLELCCALGVAAPSTPAEDLRTAWLPEEPYKVVASLSRRKAPC